MHQGAFEGQVLALQNPHFRHSIRPPCHLDCFLLCPCRYTNTRQSRDAVKSAPGNLRCSRELPTTSWRNARIVVRHASDKSAEWHSAASTRPRKRRSRVQVSRAIKRPRTACMSALPAVVVLKSFTATSNGPGVRSRLIAEFGSCGPVAPMCLLPVSAQATGSAPTLQSSSRTAPQTAGAASGGPGRRGSARASTAGRRRRELRRARAAT